MNFIQIRDHKNYVVSLKMPERNVEQDADWIIKSLLKYWPDGYFKAKRLAVWQYKLEPTDIPFGAFWPQDVLRLFMKDLGHSDEHIALVMEG